jgi:O-antigen/teichoic acid export membrane protein
MVATACSAALVAGFPVLLQLTSPHGLGAEAGTVIAVVTVTRAPLLLALNAYQALLIRRFTLERGHLRGELRRIVVPTIALATLLTALAWLLGPWALRLVFGAAFSPSRALVAGLAANAGLLVLLSICALAVLSLGSQRTYAAVWLAATVVSVLALTLPLGVEARTMLALAVGPAVGIGLSLLRIARDAQAEGRA